MRRLYSALITLSIIWGASFLFIKLLAPVLGPWGVVFWRCSLGAATLIVILILKKERIRWREIPYVSIAAVGLVNNVLPFGLIAIGEMSISSSVASVMNAMTPISTVLIGSLLFTVRVERVQWFGILLGFSGILILVRLDVTQLAAGDAGGMLMVLLATFCYALGGQLTRKYLGNVSVVLASASTLSAASILSFFMMLFTSQEPYELLPSADLLFPLVGLGVFGSGIAYVLYFYMVKEGGAEFASFVTYIVPLSAIVWGFMILGEPVTYHMIIGLALIFSGVYLSTIVKRKDYAKSKGAA